MHTTDCSTTTTTGSAYPYKTLYKPQSQHNARMEEDIFHYSLDNALPDNHILALDVSLGTMSMLCLKGELPYLEMQQQFTRGEVSMLLPLLNNYPYYCPYEVLYASFYSNDTSENEVERSRIHLQKALDTGNWDQEMRPVRTLLSRTRFKTRVLSIDILSILETGYILRFLPFIRPQVPPHPSQAEISFRHQQQ